MLQAFGRDSIFVFNGIIFLCVLLPLIQLFYPSKQEVTERSQCVDLGKKDEGQSDKEESNWSLLKNPLLWIFSFATLFAGTKWMQYMGQ